MWAFYWLIWQEHNNHSAVPESPGPDDSNLKGKEVSYLILPQISAPHSNQPFWWSPCPLAKPYRSQSCMQYNIRLVSYLYIVVIFSRNTVLATEKLPRWHSGKEFAWQCRKCKRCKFNLWVGKIPWRRKCQYSPAFLPGKFHEERSLAGYRPWGHKESDMTDNWTLPEKLVLLNMKSFSQGHVQVAVGNSIA